MILNVKFRSIQLYENFLTGIAVNFRLVGKDQGYTTSMSRGTHLSDESKKIYQDDLGWYEPFVFPIKAKDLKVALEAQTPVG